MGPVAVEDRIPGRTTVRAAGARRFPWAEPDRAGGYETTRLAAVPRAAAAPSRSRGPSRRASGVHGRRCPPDARRASTGRQRRSSVPDGGAAALVWCRRGSHRLSCRLGRAALSLNPPIPAARRRRNAVAMRHRPRSRWFTTWMLALRRRRIHRSRWIQTQLARSSFSSRECSSALRWDPARSSATVPWVRSSPVRPSRATAGRRRPQ